MKKIKNNILYKNIMILLITGALSKIIGMISKIMYTRISGIEVIGLFTLISPCFMLFINLSMFSFPISISKICAEDKYKNEDLLKNAYFLSIIINIFLSIIILLTANKIVSLLHNNSLKICVISIILIIPFISINSIQRGFLNGKEDMLMPSITNIIEEIIKIILIIIVLPIAIKYNNIIAVTTLILFNVVTELCTVIILNKKIKNKYVNKNGKIKKYILKDMFKISYQTTSVRLISLIGFFLEPIILTNLLTKQGLDINYITKEYGIINSYILPLLSMPTFFIIAISQALLPNVTKLYANKNNKEFINKIVKLSILSLIIGIISITVILIFPDLFLRLIYNINYGKHYLYLIGPFFLILYIQPVLQVVMQASNKTKKMMYVSIISVSIKYMSLYLFCKNGFGINSLIYSIMIGISLNTFLLGYFVTKK